MKNRKQVNVNLRTSNRSKAQSWFLLFPKEDEEAIRNVCIVAFDVLFGLENLAGRTTLAQE